MDRRIRVTSRCVTRACSVREHSRVLGRSSLVVVLQGLEQPTGERSKRCPLRFQGLTEAARHDMGIGPVIVLAYRLLADREHRGGRTRVGWIDDRSRRPQGMTFPCRLTGSLFATDLRGQEAGKIACGKAHFAAVAAGDAPARFVQATKLEEVLAHGGG